LVEILSVPSIFGHEREAADQQEVRDSVVGSSDILVAMATVTKVSTFHYS